MHLYLGGRSICSFAMVIVISLCTYAFSESENYAQFYNGMLWGDEGEQVCRFAPESNRFIACYIIDRHLVQGTQRGTIRMNLYAEGPFGFFGYTETEIRTGEDSQGRCMIAVISNIRVPKHENPRTLQDQLRKDWEAMLAALERHEWNHHLIAVDEAYSEFVTGCSTVGALSKRLDELNAQYDEITAHGRAEGVRF